LPYGASDMKRQRKLTGPDLVALAAKINAEDRETLVQAAVEALGACSAQQDHLEGNRISGILKMQWPGRVEAVKAAVGGKGWLKVLLETTQVIRQVEVAGKSEPCYSLILGMASTDAECLAGVAPSWLLTQQSRPVAPAGSAPPAMATLPAGMAAPAGLLLQGELTAFGKAALVEAAAIALAQDERGYLEGNRLSEAMRNAHPEFYAQGRATLGGKDGKGWLKKLLQAEQSIKQLEVDGLKEPCYCLAEHADVALQALVHKVPRVAAPAAVAPPTAGVVHANPAAHTALVEQSNAVLLEATVAILSSVPQYLEGNKLSEALKAQHPELVDLTRTSLGGKGWLKKLLERDARVGLVKVVGLYEPCYALTWKCAGGTAVFHREQPPTAGAVRARGPLGAHADGEVAGEASVLERIGGEDAAALGLAAVSVLEACPAQAYLEGSKIAERMKQLQPELVERVKTKLRKGWLKAVLELEPRILPVEVEDRNEPCYRLNR